MKNTGTRTKKVFGTMKKVKNSNNENKSSVVDDNDADIVEEEDDEEADDELNADGESQIRDTNTTNTSDHDSKLTTAIKALKAEQRFINSTPTTPENIKAKIEILIKQWNEDLTPKQRAAVELIAEREQRAAASSFNHHYDDLKRLWRPRSSSSK